MYRTYENPYTIEQRIEVVKNYLNRNPDDVDAYIELDELRDRLNFAWQDDEFENE